MPMAMIKDGASNTYLIGERLPLSGCYYMDGYCDNDQGWDQGYDYDSNRGTGYGYVKLVLTCLPMAAVQIPIRRPRTGLVYVLCVTRK